MQAKERQTGKGVRLCNLNSRESTRQSDRFYSGKPEVTRLDGLIGTEISVEKEKTKDKVIEEIKLNKSYSGDIISKNQEALEESSREVITSTVTVNPNINLQLLFFDEDRPDWST